MKIRWRGPLLAHLHPASAVEIEEPLVVDMLALEKLWKHLPVAADWPNPSRAVTLSLRAKVATLDVHVVIKLADAVLVAGVVAGVECHHQFSRLSRSISRSSRYLERFSMIMARFVLIRNP